MKNNFFKRLQNEVSSWGQPSYRLVDWPRDTAAGSQLRFYPPRDTAAGSQRVKVLFITHT